MLARILGSIAVMAALTACQKALSQADMRPLASLAGTEWAPANSNLDQFIAFRAGGDVVGSGGCNNFFGSFAQNGRSITFGPLANTKKACHPEIMAAEQSFMNVLSRARAVEANRRELVLYDQQNNILAILQRRN